MDDECEWENESGPSHGQSLITVCSTCWNNASNRQHARIRELEAALRAIADADRTYPDKRIADDMQYRARLALEPRRC